ncbi:MULTISPECIES: Eco57I restriction-modification methylase domain-containing protein [unclassified Microcoleus]
MANQWDSYVRDNLLNRLFGFELLMAPYAIAHLKLGLELQELGYKFKDKQRLGIYLTNTLDEAMKKSEILFGQFVAQEANEASMVKRDTPVMVVLGNPPYSGHSANKSKWIESLVQDYYYVDGLPLGERNSKWLQDDYVKFIRFGQWRVSETGYGVLAFVTNHGYLDNPTFRGMRQNLMQTFTDIYILDLHGNSKKKEVSPDGSPDQNVFDIQQAVSIGIFIKAPGKHTPAKVHHAELWGDSASKYESLNLLDINQ